MLHLLSIQQESFQYFHQNYLLLCLHIFTSFMSSNYLSGYTIALCSLTSPMILSFNGNKGPYLIPLAAHSDMPSYIIHHCLNLLQQIIKICQVRFIHNFQKIIPKSKLFPIFDSFSRSFRYSKSDAYINSIIA